MKIKILPSALADLDRGRQFYADQEPSVGDYFLDALFSDIDSLVLYAGDHATVFEFHRLLAKRFPFAVYYKVDGDVCIVLSRTKPWATGGTHLNAVTRRMLVMTSP